MFAVITRNQSTSTSTSTSTRYLDITDKLLMLLKIDRAQLGQTPTIVIPNDGEDLTYDDLLLRASLLDYIHTHSVPTIEGCPTNTLIIEND